MFNNKSYSMKNLILIIDLVVSFQTMQGQQLSDLSFGTDQTFEVVTWNIEQFPKSGVATMDSVKIIIESLDVDVLALQEIKDTNAFKSVMANLPDYGVFFGNNQYINLTYVYKKATVNIQNYYAIYTSSNYSSFFPRKPKVLELTFNGEEFIIINNHLKCCGDGTLLAGNASDEENRRYQAMILLKNYIDTNFPNKNVIVTGDLNDVLTDSDFNNVFQTLIDDDDNYLFADMAIANGAGFNWSYPSWPSHLDHILITNELFDEFNKNTTVVETILIDNYMQGGFSAYDSKVSDHRPVGLKFEQNPVSTENMILEDKSLIIFPNPSNGRLTISFEQPTKDSHINIYNANGQVVKSLAVRDGEMKADYQFADLPNGLYWLQYSSENELIVTEKFVILK